MIIYKLDSGIIRKRNVGSTLLLVLLAIIYGVSVLISPFKPTNVSALAPEWQTNGFSSISAGEYHTCGLSTASKLWCWGNNSAGQLGNNSTTASSIPVAVDTTGVLSGKTITRVSTGSYSTCVLASGSPYCWGNNYDGQAGDGSSGDTKLVPVAVDTTGVLSGKTITDLDAGDFSACVLANAKPYCWGSGGFGQLGNGDNSNNPSAIPVAVDVTGVLNNKSVTSIDLGYGYACVIADGNSYCWGNNIYGQLGDNTTTNSLVPVAVDTTGVLSGATISHIASGRQSACAIANGNAYCWGRNPYGGLGNNSTNDSSVPVAVDMTGVLSGKTITALSAGAYSACVLASGKPYCWGAGGQLGDNSSNDSLVPVAVNTTGVLSGKTITALSGRSGTSCVLATTQAFCWGGNTYGELGSAISATNSNVPVAVTDGTPILNDEEYEVLADSTPHQITLTGDSFNDAITVTIDGVPVTPSYIQGLSISVEVPGSSVEKSVNITVTNPNGKSATLVNGLKYYKNPEPTITSVDFSDDTDVPSAQRINLHGTNFNTSYADGLSRSLVTLNGQALPFCTTPNVYTVAVLTGANINPALFSNSAPCYIMLVEGSSGPNALSSTLYQIRVSDSFDTSSFSVRLDGMTNPYIYGAPAPETPAYISNVPSGFVVTDFANTDLSTTGTTDNQLNVLLKTTAGRLVAEIPVNTTTDRDWSSVTAGVDAQKSMAFVHGITSAPGVTGGTFALYVPKKSEHNAVIICPGAASLAELSADCPGAKTYREGDENVSVVLGPNLTWYWRIAGLTGTGGLSVELDSTSSLSDTGLPILVLELAAGFIIIAAVIISSKKRSVKTPKI